MYVIHMYVRVLQFAINFLNELKRILYISCSSSYSFTPRAFFKSIGLFYLAHNIQVTFYFIDMWTYVNKFMCLVFDRRFLEFNEILFLLFSSLFSSNTSVNHTVTQIPIQLL